MLQTSNTVVLAYYEFNVLTITICKGVQLNSISVPVVFVNVKKDCQLNTHIYYVSYGKIVHI